MKQERLDPMLKKLKFIHPMIKNEDFELAKYLEEGNIMNAHYTFSWVKFFKKI